jgi:3-hydroxy-9,10-secoandrosta-1,3,5(10)-triene-9,17-dione monooxygenase
MPTSTSPIIAPRKPDLTPDEIVQRARELRPELIKLQADTEQRTYYSSELHRSFEEAGFYRFFVPRYYGGYEFDVPTFARLLIELARGCMSTAWCLGLVSGHALQVASYYSESVQAEVFGRSDFRAAAALQPGVIATPERGGWRLDGEVGYCSGVPYATHFLGQALPAGFPPAQQHLMVYLAPRSEWIMHNDWGDTLGLKGSGSHSIAFKGGWVPDHYVLKHTELTNVDVSGGTAGARLYGNPLYAGRSLSVFSIVLAALMVGAGYSGLDEYEQLMHRCTSSTSLLSPAAPRYTDPDYQRWFGLAHVQLATAEAALLRCAQMHMEACQRAASGGAPYSMAEEQHLAAIAREVSVQVWETSDRNLFRTIGSGAMRTSSRMERIYRDMSMAITHRNNVSRDPIGRLLGQLCLSGG